jgi:hypothetical protein
LLLRQQVDLQRAAGPIVVELSLLQLMEIKSLTSVNPVSGRRLPKTGIFQYPAGDFRRFRPESVKIQSLETEANSQKPAISGPFCEYQGHFL